MKVEYMKACPYCGQMRTFESSVPGLSDEEQTAEVARTCTCDEAECGRWMARTDDGIRNVLGDESVKRGFDYEIDEETISLVRSLARRIYDGDINNVSFVEANGDTIKLNKGSDRIKIGRVCKKQVVM